MARQTGKKRPARTVTFTLLEGPPTPEQLAAWDELVAYLLRPLTDRHSGSNLLQNTEEESA